MQYEISRGCLVAAGFALAALIAVFVVAHPFVEMVVGEEFLPAYPVILILAVGTFVSTLTGSVAIAMQSARMEKTVFVAVLISVVTNLLLGLILAPRFGATGIAISTSIGLVLWNAILLVVARRRLGVTALPTLAALRRR